MADRIVKAAGDICPRHGLWRPTSSSDYREFEVGDVFPELEDRMFWILDDPDNPFDANRGLRPQQQLLDAADLTTAPPELGRPGLQVNDALITTTTEQVAVPTHSSDWTGRSGRTALLRQSRDRLLAAQVSIGFLIDTLEQPGPNGGPPLDEQKAAIDDLKHLHEALGALLDAIDGRRLTDELGEGLVADLVRWGHNFFESIKTDPVRYGVSLSIFAVLDACGAGDWAETIAGLAASVSGRRKP